MGKGFHVDVVQEHLEKEAEVHFKYFSGHFAKVGQGGGELICCRFYWKSLTENHQMVDRCGAEKVADDTGGRNGNEASFCLILNIKYEKELSVTIGGCLLGVATCFALNHPHSPS